MTDPWDTAARNIAAQRTAQQRAAQQHAAQEQAEKEMKAAAARAAQTDMEAAIRDAIPLLVSFLEERGAAARHLLTACGEHTVVVFGNERGGGNFSGVFLHSRGLLYEEGETSGHSSTVRKERPATPEEAVKAFAHEGPGCGKPEVVRNIVKWLTDQLDSIASSRS